ncbi:MAG: hypothetical protein DRP18_04345 [Candidatus Aenigmatarchaeota archaeon]|nr:MAG: hypothetical protein DRP18_04345 [Candidatus Aenigmarchaeota archaeon]
MKIKDRVTDWFIRKTLIPRMVSYDTPGFIQEKLTPSSKTGTPLRNVMISETAIAEIEKNLFSKFGEKAKAVLYKSGKEFGIRYSKMEMIPDIKSPTRNSMWYFFLRTFETVFAEKIEDRTNWEKKTLELTYRNFVICRKSGVGSFFTEGVVAGYWSSICKDPTIEGVQFACEGRGDKQCKAIYAPFNILVKKYPNINKTPIHETNVSQIYYSFNELETSYSQSLSSVKKLMDAGKIEYNKGKFLYSDERFFPMELSSLHILEKNIFEAFGKPGVSIVFDSSFLAGKKLTTAEKVSEENKTAFTIEIMSAFGWGLPKKLSEGKIYFEKLPWSEYFDAKWNKYFEGFVSGLLCQEQTRTKFRYFTAKNQLNAIAEVVKT